MKGFEADGGAWVAYIDGPFAGTLARLCDEIAGELQARSELSDGQGRGAGTVPASGTGTLPGGAGMGPGGDVPGSAGEQWPGTGDDLARLNPPVSQDDPERAAEFRRFTQADLDAGRIERLSWFGSLLRGSKYSLLRPVRVAISPDEGGKAAATLNDLRLVLAQRLQIDDAEAAEHVYQRAISGGPGSIFALLYVVASVLQETLIELMMG